MPRSISNKHIYIYDNIQICRNKTPDLRKIGLLDGLFTNHKFIWKSDCWMDYSQITKLSGKVTVGWIIHKSQSYPEKYLLDGLFTNHIFIRKSVS